MVSNASDDFPDPLGPVMTTSRSRGKVRLMFLRLCWRAPRTTSRSMGVGRASTRRAEVVGECPKSSGTGASLSAVSDRGAGAGLARRCGPPTMGTMSLAIQAKNYRGLVEVDWTVPPGLSVVVGANGAGKTTLLLLFDQLSEAVSPNRKERQMTAIFAPDGRGAGL